MKSVFMVKRCLILFFAIASALAATGQNPPFKELTIGNQIWMDRNLNVTHFRNGDEIPHARTAQEWQQAAENGKPAWCFYNNDPKNEAAYGRLYNWFAVTDPRGLGPEGWRVPSDYDWGLLERHLGMSLAQVEQFEWRGTDQGNKLRQEGTQFWRAPNAGANNQSGFTALPGGYRQPGGVFETMGIYGSWWTSSQLNDQHAYYRDLSAVHSGVYRGAYPKGCGFAVRLIKAEGTRSRFFPDLTDRRDGNVYKLVRIGGNVWMAENLRFLPEVHSNSAFAQAGKNSQPGFGVAGYNGSDLETAKSHENYKKYGVLYNWWAASDICPAGWHLPSDAEWTELSNFLLGEKVAGNKMKSTSGWSDAGNGGNRSGFNGLPGGMRTEDGRSDRMGSFGYWWSSSEYIQPQTYAHLLDRGEELADNRAWARRLSSREAELSRNHSSKAFGRSVRCIRKYHYYREIQENQSPEIDPADEKKEVELIPGLEESVGFVLEEPDSIIPDSMFLTVITMTIQGPGTGIHPPGPSPDTLQVLQLGAEPAKKTADEKDIELIPDLEKPTGIVPEEPDSIIKPDALHIYVTHESDPGVQPPAPVQDTEHGQQLGDEAALLIADPEEPVIEVIGQQVWMKRNLNVTTFRNGDPIPQALTLGDWIEFGNAGQPAWGYYDNDPERGKLLGKLYNWYAVNDPRGLAPEGWRIPTKEDFQILINKAGGMDAYEALEYGGSSGFDGLLGGWQNPHGGYGRWGIYGYWWSSTEADTYIAWYFGMYSIMEIIYLLEEYKSNGFSVRCIKE